MSAIPGDIDTGSQPPMTVPLRHFLVALAFLLAGAVLGGLDAVGVAPGTPRLAHVHLLLVGWVCLTIMGAMTQFVPVWSGTELHSKRLATLQLWLAVAGLLGLATGFLTGWFRLLAPAGGLLLAGFWVFAYNVGRTLAGQDGYDVTERHFALALAFFVLATALGHLLAVDAAWPLLTGLPVTRGRVLGAHVTLALFGGVLTTVIGALYQLGTMFTQTDLHGVDTTIRTVESVGYPVGVLALSAGRLADVLWLARGGGVLVVVAVFGFAVVLARRLAETPVDWTPMLSRYVVALGMAAWSLLTVGPWFRDPTRPGVLYGAPGTAHLLAAGVVGFVVLGTLYHIVPFIVWIHRYSDRIGFESVPMVDDLYDARLAAVDFVAIGAGTALLVVAGLVPLPPTVVAVAGVLLSVGAAVFTLNMVLVVRRHGSRSVVAIVFDASADETPAEQADGATTGDR
ncbi:hypothetical protein [Halorientalis litorea]|uniref:hypothetical protein n=1 Tax=Halorientalis litorea TaxID=2931977 RepID=UPI001FF2418B|nr:hypothetical protein [Halorientalis litorea]